MRTPQLFERRTPFRIHDACAAGYLATVFEVATDPTLPLEVGQRSEAADALLMNRKAQALVVITAWNPFSCACRDEDNRRRQQRLINEVETAGLRWLPAFGRGPSEDWRGEQSLAVFDTPNELLRDWIVRFGQAAALELARSAPAQLIWHPDAIPPATLAPHRSPRHPVVEADYCKLIEHVLVDGPCGAGNFQESGTQPHGTPVVHRFSWATGMGWLHRQKLYRDAFGELPGWLLPLNPRARSSLIELALSLDAALPLERKLPGGARPVEVGELGEGLPT